MILKPPSDQAPYPAPIPDWLEKGETPTPEQAREELLRLARIVEKKRAEAIAKADVQASIQTRSKVATEAAARYWAETD